MKALMMAATAAAALSLPVLAHADQPAAGTTTFNGYIGYSGARADDVNLGAVQGRLGVRFGQYLGIEGELAGGVDSDTVDVLGTPTDVKLQHQEAIYGVGYLPVNPNFDLLARVGYGHSEISASGPSVPLATASGNSWNYGVGGQYYFDGSNGLRVDYTRHDFSDGGPNANVWSVGYTRRF